MDRARQRGRDPGPKRQRTRQSTANRLGDAAGGSSRDFRHLGGESLGPKPWPWPSTGQSTDGGAFPANGSSRLRASTGRDEKSPAASGLTTRAAAGREPGRRPTDHLRRAATEDSVYIQRRVPETPEVEWVSEWKSAEQEPAHSPSTLSTTGREGSEERDARVCSRAPCCVFLDFAVFSGGIGCSLRAVVCVLCPVVD